MTRISTILAAVFLVTACTAFPELDAHVSEQAQGAPYPVLLPSGDIAALGEGSAGDGDGIEALAARAEELKARGAAVSGPVLTPEERARLEAAL